MRSKLFGLIILCSLFTASLWSNRAATQAQENPVDRVSKDHLMAALEELTAIQAYSGWRNSGSTGEQEALDYVKNAVASMEFLTGLGTTFEPQTFHVLLATDIWESQLYFTLNGQEIEIPADALRGSRDNISRAQRFDSDGEINDSDRNPVERSGTLVIVKDKSALAKVSKQDMSGQVLIVDAALVDQVVLTRQTAIQNAQRLTDTNPAGIVLVTQFSNKIGPSHGSFVGEGTSFSWIESGPKFPLLFARLEDMAPAGIQTWDDLAEIEAARLIWDADIFSPGTSGNLVVRIPGQDSSHAVILGAHIDSPNSPGAFDDGSGSVVLLEVARVLNDARLRPPTDVYLVWFGSEELGLYDSAHFALTHQELLDRTLGMFNVDCLGYPLDGIDTRLELNTWSFGHFGDKRILWPDYLKAQADMLGIETKPASYYWVESDSSSFGGFGVPHVNLIYENGPIMNNTGGVHYSDHLHDPYDTTVLAGKVSDVLVEMAQMAVTAALNTGRDLPTLRVTPEPAGRVVFVASQTESVQMTPALDIELGMAFLMQGLNVNVIPYGQVVTAADLAGAAMVIVLPPLDYPTDASLYDVAWTEADADLFEQYTAAGGKLVLVNSANLLDFVGRPIGANEDWPDLNPIAQRFGVTFIEKDVPNDYASLKVKSPLFKDLTRLFLLKNNGVPFTLTQGEVLATAGDQNIVAQIPYGDQHGAVLVLADMGLFTPSLSENYPTDLPFWRNLAAYAAGQ